MKKTYIFLIVAALCAFGVSAKSIYIWRNGVKTELPIQTNDSITFEEGSAPTMHIWRNGSEIYELALVVDDSITYSLESPEPPTAVCFDYDHWRDVDTINIYEFNGHTWQTIALPWASVTSTTIPAYYRYPNLQFHVDTVNHDTVPIWQLAFNTCHNPLVEGVHMFGLWDEKGNIMRIYSYLEEKPNSNAAYCFYRTEASSPAYIDRDAMAWMPSDSIIRKANWNNAALSGVAAVPSTTICDLMPFATLKDDGSEAFTPVQPGWLCFDLPLTGKFKVPEGGTITFSLEAVQVINATGSLNLNMALSGTGTGTGTGTEIGKSTSTGGITIPANKSKKAAGRWNAWGSFIHDLGSAITSGVSAGNADSGGEAGIAGGVVQGIGSVCSMIGNYKNATEDSNEKRYTLDFTTVDTTNINMAYDFHFDFNGTIAGQFDAQLTSTLPSSAKPLTISYEKFFEGILAHPKPNQAAKIRKDNGSSNGNNLSLGIWNLKHQPVFYVCGDFKFDDGTLISFLDPSSIELILNQDNVLFDSDEIDSMKLVAYDFVFVDNAYNFPTQPYYDFYGIPRDPINVSTSIIGGLDDTDFLLNDTASYQTFTKDGISYTGVSSSALVDAGLGMYNMVYSPKISTSLSNPALNSLGVAVVLEITFKNGEKRIFAERFLPQIKTFSMEDIKDLCTRIQDSDAPTIEGINIEYKLFYQQKAKALRLLYAARFPVVTYLLAPFGDVIFDMKGILIKSSNENQQEIVIAPYVNPAEPKISPAPATLVNFRDYLLNENVNFDVLNSRLEKQGIPSLNNYINTQLENYKYNVETGEEEECVSEGVDLYFYTIGEDGIFVMLTEEISF